MISNQTFFNATLYFALLLILFIFPGMLTTFVMFKFFKMSENKNYTISLILSIMIMSIIIYIYPEFKYPENIAAFIIATPIGMITGRKICFIFKKNFNGIINFDHLIQDFHYYKWGSFY